MEATRLRFLVLVIVLTVVVAMAFAFSVANRDPADRPVFGVTFSTFYAEELGIDPRAAFLATLDELGVRDIRFPLYWSEIEAEEGAYAWEETDWYVREAEARGARLTLVIGQKVPRWPECFIPAWAGALGEDARHAALLDYLELAVRRYRESAAVARWQVENEPFFPFGECPRPELGRYLEELALVRSLDARPVQRTVSGELEPWIDAALTADLLGISMYRVTWNDYYGYSSYPITPGVYAARAASVRPFVDAVLISELQAEPWFPEPISAREPEEWYRAFTEEDFGENVDFAVLTGLDEAYLWGVEWWYFLRERGESRLWDAAEALFNGADG